MAYTPIKRGSMTRALKYRLSVTVYSSIFLIALFALAHWSPPKKSLETKQYAQPIECN